MHDFARDHDYPADVEWASRLVESFLEVPSGCQGVGLIGMMIPLLFQPASSRKHMIVAVSELDCMLQGLLLFVAHGVGSAAAKVDTIAGNVATGN